MLGEGNPGVATTLHAALGQDDFATFIQEKAVETGVDLKRITLPPPGEGEAAAGTGVCMVLSGWTDAARTCESPPSAAIMPVASVHPLGQRRRGTAPPPPPPCPAC
eukprot:COSAG04_NODE_1111_length_8227_cov_4.702510_5_plen_106_part_00